MRFLVVALFLASCGPTGNWKCVDNAGFNCTCHSPPLSGETASSCASYSCCLHYDDAAGPACTCKNASDTTCTTTEINARTAAGATNVYRVSACPG